jgi:hypothetical protein
MMAGSVPEQAIRGPFGGIFIHLRENHIVFSKYCRIYRTVFLELFFLHPAMRE